MTVERRAYTENAAAQETAYWYCREHDIRVDDLDIGQILQVAAPIILAEREAIWLERLRKADERYDIVSARHLDTQRQFRAAVEALEACKTEAKRHKDAYLAMREENGILRRELTE
jgi:hypothetical protein